MSFQLALVLSAVMVVGAVVVLVIRMEGRRQAAVEDQLRGEASARGWTFQTDREPGFRVRRWTGTTDGIAWSAESRRSARQRRHRGQGAQRMRWWADTVRGPSGAVLFLGVPEGDSGPSFTVAAGGGVLARLAQKATGLVFDHAVDLYFGREAGAQVDAGALEKVDGQVPPGYFVMAADRAEGARVLFSGMSEAMRAVDSDLRPEDPEESRPWVLLLPRRVSIARMDPIRSTAELERVARAGAALVRRT
ncbi:MAG: hypothetical protein OEW19_17490 [Acidobacteriota bacterium]|nr:hypothetical protein [Acidobacteriota bacterium]